MKRRAVWIAVLAAVAATVLGVTLSAHADSEIRDPAEGVPLKQQPEVEVDTTATLDRIYGSYELAPGEWEKVEAARQRGEGVGLVEDENGQLRVRQTGGEPIPDVRNPAWQGDTASDGQL